MAGGVVVCRLSGHSGRGDGGGVPTIRRAGAPRLALGSEALPRSQTASPGTSFPPDSPRITGRRGWEGARGRGAAGRVVGGSDCWRTTVRPVGLGQRMRRATTSRPQVGPVGSWVASPAKSAQTRLAWLPAFVPGGGATPGNVATPCTLVTAPRTLARRANRRERYHGRTGAAIGRSGPVPADRTRHVGHGRCPGRANEPGRRAVAATRGDSGGAVGAATGPVGPAACRVASGPPSRRRAGRG